MEISETINIAWILLCAAMVFIMQAGFCCLESGLVRTKNSINVAIKNLIDLCIAGILFWCFGYAVMFGTSWHGWFGTAGFFFDSDRPAGLAFFVFQLMFCGAATTIVAGAVAERIRFVGYIVVATLISGLIYPVFGHWSWGAGGWLRELGFRDFAGSTVVHSVGGWIALAACLVLGPRIGRFDERRQQEMVGHNLPLATIGLMLLWFGWFGFNGGSAFVLDETVPRIITATALSGMAGGLAALIHSWLTTRHHNVVLVMNGVLAGLVGITASCNIVSLPAAVAIGAIGGVISSFCISILTKMGIDDVVGAVAVHGGAGVWGTIALALFPPDGSWNTGLVRWEQLGVQCIGVAVCFSWAFGGGFLILSLVNRFCPLRVSHEAEEVGLNIAEHNASTETHLLFEAMDLQRKTGDFSEPVAGESFTEIGRIALQYNRVLSVVNKERHELVEANLRAQEANSELTSAQKSLQVKLKELSEFNEMAVDRELRMIELKGEINAYCEQLGVPPQFELDSFESHEALP